MEIFINFNNINCYSMNRRKTFFSLNGKTTFYWIKEEDEKVLSSDEGEKFKKVWKFSTLVMRRNFRATCFIFYRMKTHAPTSEGGGQKLKGDDKSSCLRSPNKCFAAIWNFSPLEWHWTWWISRWYPSLITWHLVTTILHYIHFLL